MIVSLRETSAIVERCRLRLQWVRASLGRLVAGYRASTGSSPTPRHLGAVAVMCV
jgi:hypothetical protein